MGALEPSCAGLLKGAAPQATVKEYAPASVAVVAHPIGQISPNVMSPPSAMRASMFFMRRHFAHRRRAPAMVGGKMVVTDIQPARR